MAIQNRRGNIADFDANKMLPGEFAYALDTSELFYCVAPGTVKRCATKEELEQILAATPEAYSALQELIADLESETVLTGILADISNLKSTKLALTGDSKTNTTTFTEAATLANIVTGETHATLFGKIKKFFSFVGTTTLTTTAQTVSAAANEILAANRSGWSTLLVTDKLTYKSASAPTFVCNTLNTSNVARDFRAYLSIGMKIKITQDAVIKYFFVTAIDATSITLYGGTDYVLTNAAITNVCYSVVQSPHSFPNSLSGTSMLLYTIAAITETASAVIDMKAFKWIYVEFINSELIVDARTIPLDTFNNGSTVQLNTFYTSYAYGNIRYVNDTHITGYVSLAGTSIKVYGIK